MEKRLVKAINFIEQNWDRSQFFAQQTIFPSIIILDSLNSCDLVEADKLKTKIANQLIKEKSEYYSFNYWLKNSDKYKTEPYPDDLDDSFYAWAALKNYDNSLLDGDVLADLTRILLKTQVKDGGPYYTWIVEEEDNEKWRDLDFAVNCNIAYFLSLEEIELDGLNSFLEEKVNGDDLDSLFYKDQYASLYFLSRFYKGHQKKFLKNKIKKLLSQKINILDLVLLLIAASRLGFDDLITKKLLKKVSKAQADDGGFAAYDFYFYIDREKKEDFIKDRSLTTALVIELWSLIYLPEKRKEELDQWKEDLAVFFETKLELIKNKEIEKEFKLIGNKIISKDKDGFILFLPLLLYLSLKDKKEIKKDYFLNLALINLFFWIAFTIYDDFNDEGKTYQYLSDDLVSLPLLGGTMPKIEQCIEEKGMIILALDAILPIKHKQDVNFFGTKFKMTSGPLWLADQFALPIFSVYSVLEQQKQVRIRVEEFKLSKQTNLEKKLNQMAKRIESYIHKHPGSWNLADDFFALHFRKKE